MAAGDFFTAPVERIAAGGSGVLHWEGKTIFMAMAAPGDLVRGRITEEHGRWARAALEAVLEPSANRRPPFCPLYGRCGGCSLQHLDYAAQAAEKAAVFKELLARVGGIKEAPFGAIAQSPPIEYRNRVSFHSSAGRPAFKSRGGGAAIPLDDCPILDGAI